jgi:tRNA G18 (ribose-2'-O)-methylase SpoU
MNLEYPLSFHEINPDPEERSQLIRNNPNPIIFLLDEMEDIENLGAMFRLADAGRIAGIYAYKTKIKFTSKKLERVSRQTFNHINFKELNDIEEISELAKKYFPIALEYTNKSIPFKAYKKTNPCLLIIGNEKRGVSQELLNLCKASVHIPMLGQNSSMNVGVAAGIILYHLLSNFGEV